MFLRGLFDDPTYRFRAKFGLFDDNDGGEQGGGAGEGGAGTGEGQGEQGARSEGDGQGGEGARSSGAQGRNPNHWIPKPRFDEVNRGFQAYKKYGSPVEIQAKLDRLAALEKQPQNRYTEQQTAEIREDLLRVFPELRDVTESRQRSKDNFADFGARQNDVYAKELGIEANEANNQFLQDMIGGVIARDPKLARRFFALDQSVFNDAWKVVKTMIPNANRRTVPGLGVVRDKNAAKPGNNGKDKKSLDERIKEVQPGPLFERNVLDQASEEAFSRISDQME